MLLLTKLFNFFNLPNLNPMNSFILHNQQVITLNSILRQGSVFSKYLSFKIQSHILNRHVSESSQFGFELLNSDLHIQLFEDLLLSIDINNQIQSFLIM
jgi:hypothetical protein